MEFNQNDLDLFETAKGIMHRTACTSDRLTAYTMDAKLVWAGAHYLLIRSGPFEGKKDAEIWSREALLLRRGNPTKNAMVEIALATIPLIHKKWAQNLRRTVWRQGSRAQVAHGKFNYRRWSKSLVADLIEFCEEQDRSFQEREAKAISNLEESHTFSQGICKLMIDQGFKVCGTTRVDDVQFPCGYRFHVNMVEGTTGRRNEVRLRPTSRRVVEVELTTQEFDQEEFEFLAEALGKIREKRRKETE